MVQRPAIALGEASGMMIYYTPLISSSNMWHA